MCLGIVTLVLGLAYVKSLVRTYTSIAPAPLPEVAFDRQRHRALTDRWAEFAQALQRRQNPPPFDITAADLNLFFAQDKQMSRTIGFAITNNQLVARFSAPLDQVHRPELKGRYLNGEAKIKLHFEDGWLSASLGEITANGEPLPAWLVKLTGLPKQNLLKDVERNRDTVNLLHELDSLEIRDDKIVLTPLSGAK